jgi:hypothetical protein
MHGIEDWIDMTSGTAVMEYPGEGEVTTAVDMFILVDVSRADVVEVDDCASAPTSRMEINAGLHCGRLAKSQDFGIETREDAHNAGSCRTATSQTSSNDLTVWRQRGFDLQLEHLAGDNKCEKYG